MSDRYAQLVNTPVGRLVSRQIGLPRPVELERHRPGMPAIDGPVLLGAAQGSRLTGATARVLAGIGAEVHTELREELRQAVADAGLDARVFNPEAAGERERFKALVFDASGIAEAGALEACHAFLAPSIRRLARCGRVILLGTSPEHAQTPAEAIAQRALEGLMRSVGKEVGRRGATAQLLYVAPRAEGQMESTLRFVISPRSAYVSGQVIRIAAPRRGAPGSRASDDLDWERPLSGRVALVTGAARGIGRAIAQVLARDGAHVVCLDVPAVEAELESAAGALGGSALACDITDHSAGEQIAAALDGALDVVVHNAGITRDRTLARMSEQRWREVMEVNLLAPQRLTSELAEREVIGAGGRVVCISSISGIAGNAGQTNYATSKAGVIGLVQAFAPALGRRGVTINAVAPGFIETQMTAAMPIALREAGRRMNSLAQGGLPVDVAEAVAWLASPASTGITGQVVRVCGQSLLGA